MKKNFLKTPLAPLEPAANASRRYGISLGDGGLMPPSLAAKRLWFLTGLAALLMAVPVFRAAAEKDDSQVNALLLVSSVQTAFDAKFQAYPAEKGVRILGSWPPHVFTGYVPEAADAGLKARYGVSVYREKISDWSVFSAYGEKAVFAVNAWNKRFLEDPPVAPLVVSLKVASEKKGKVQVLSWNEVMKASTYRLQISRDGSFEKVFLETLLPENSYMILPAFWPDGVYYWRVSAVMRLNMGDTRESEFSDASSFAVSKAGKATVMKSPRKKVAVKPGKGLLRWGPSYAPYYRLQLSENEDFSSPLLDVFTDTCSYKVSGLPLNEEASYHARVMPSDGLSAGHWSGASKISFYVPDPIEELEKK